jgi:hypothetical protein
MNEFHEPVSDDFVLGSVDTLPRLPVFNLQGEAVGYADAHDLPNAVSRDELEHVKHDLMQLRNQVIRLQTQMRLLEHRQGGHHGG